MATNLSRLLVFVASFVGALSAVKDSLPECRSWLDIKREIEDEDKGHCEIDANCTGLNCSGNFVYLSQAYVFQVEVWVVNYCSKPIGLTIYMDIPKININNFRHTFKDGDTFELPGGNFGFGQMAVSLKRHNRSVVIDVSITPLSIPLIHNQSVSLPHCGGTSQVRNKSRSHLPKPASAFDNGLVLTTGSVHSPEKKCNIMDLKTCDASEMCVQFNRTSNTGECRCRDHYHQNGDECVSDSQDSNATRHSNLTLVLGVVIPVFLLLLATGCVFAAIRFKLVERVRSRLTHVRRYEEVAIGGEEDDEPLVA